METKTPRFAHPASGIIVRSVDWRIARALVVGASVVEENDRLWLVKVERLVADEAGATIAEVRGFLERLDLPGGNRHAGVEDGSTFIEWDRADWMRTNGLVLEGAAG